MNYFINGLEILLPVSPGAICRSTNPLLLMENIFGKNISADGTLQIISMQNPALDIFQKPKGSRLTLFVFTMMIRKICLTDIAIIKEDRCFICFGSMWAMKLSLLH